MNQVGFSMPTEFGRIIGHLGPKAVFSQVPELRRMLSKSGEWVRQSGLENDLEVVGAWHSDRLLHNPNIYYDDLTGAAHTLNRGTAMDKTEGFMRRAAHVTATISGMHVIDDALRTVAAKAIVQKWANFAHTGKGLSEKRLADLGLSKEMTERILQQFKEEGNFEYVDNLITGKKVVRAHFDNWKDLEAREAFLNSTYRFGRQMVQMNDLGMLHRYFSQPFARILMQFRSFMAGSWTRSTMKAAHMRDMSAAASLLFGSMISGLVYVAQTKLNAIGRSDRDQYEEKMLDWNSIGAAAFARSSESSIIPMIVDSVAPMMGIDPMFSHTRSSGQVSDALFGNPYTSALNSIQQGVSGVAQAVRDGHEVDQKTARTLFSLLPYRNFMPIQMMLNHFISDLPEYAPRNSRG